LVSAFSCSRISRQASAIDSATPFGWRRALTGSDETLENAHLMRLAGRFSRRVRGYAKAHDIPVIDCPVGERKHELAEEYLAKTKVTQGLFLVLVGRAPAVVWTVGAHHHIERKMPAPTSTTIPFTFSIATGAI
jgi:hypothetical protein